MNEFVFEENSKLLNDWISKNPNFSVLKFENNILTSSDGQSIDLKDFLLSSLLNNELIKNTINKMSEETFVRILKINSKAFKIENISNKYLIVDEKIKKVRINENGQAIAETDNDNIEIKDHKALKVLNTYNALIENNTVHIPLSTLLKKLNDNKFYDLINTNYELSKDDYDYINVFSDYMFDLMYDQDYLINEANKLLKNYEFTMNELKNNNNRTHNQNTALNIYLDKLRNFNIKIENKKEESHNSSPGYSSLVLIITSVVVTAMLIILLIITK